MSKDREIEVRPHYRIAYYKGIEMLWRFSVEGDQIEMYGEVFIVGLGIATMKICAESIDAEMSTTEAAERWLKELDDTEFEMLSKAVQELYVAFFYGGD